MAEGRGRRAALQGIDLGAQGRQIGALHLTHSDNRHDAGVIPVPVAVLSGGPGPTALLVAGTHGDEYEGQVVLHRLLREVDPAQVNGRIIVLPALNLPAVRAAGRVSPLDGQNLNRVYPGNARGGPTAQIAHAVVTELLPHADLALDLHSGGSTTHYVPSAFVYSGPNSRAWDAKRRMTEAMGLAWSAVVPARFEPGSFSTAADDAGVPMISTELDGGGEVTPPVVGDAVHGLRRVLAAAGILDAPAGTPAAAPTRWIDLLVDGAVHTPLRGLFEPVARLGDEVKAGELIGRVHPVEELDRSPAPVLAHRDGIVAIARRPPLVDLGDTLYHLAADTTPGTSGATGR
ncbi:succinylglutamate desuccinylase/aspartoacylase family protein [Streptomyces sp. LHD-70]|uniref:succinylglutamate desuccinylase/aspartoacylase family protein n=1 Tax=Streptomyces sp. LHD-70 TaxID=3072140 RepID=UPI0028106FDF|nr:succinylglutamate desuccinylase/aspartoacylase family protein [Streptomyces sp. LHD-70]MDQ8706116.1 succinylglutamate desuccinylase/aspartoacylase family protein [Streptomyces sp. LHD-70]